MKIPHPWEDLSRRPHIEVQWPLLPQRLLSLTDGYSRIEIDRRLSQVQRRCALDHELCHIDLGVLGGCGGPGEWRIRRHSARRMIPIKMLGQAMAYTLDLDAVAFDCWVIRPVLDDRLTWLTDAERAHLEAVTAHHRETA